MRGPMSAASCPYPLSPTDDVRPAEASDLTIRVCRGFDEAAPFLAELERDGATTVFQRLIWMRIWERRLAPARNAASLFVLVAEPGGRPLLLLPLCLRRHGWLRV